jgi:hypothetical protein
MYISFFCLSNFLLVHLGCCDLLVLVRVSLYIPQRLIEMSVLSVLPSSQADCEA